MVTDTIRSSVAWITATSPLQMLPTFTFSSVTLPSVSARSTVLSRLFFRCV